MLVCCNDLSSMAELSFIIKIWRNVPFNTLLLKMILILMKILRVFPVLTRRNISWSTRIDISPRFVVKAVTVRNFHPTIDWENNYTFEPGCHYFQGEVGVGSLLSGFSNGRKFLMYIFGGLLLSEDYRSRKEYVQAFVSKMVYLTRE